MFLKKMTVSAKEDVVNSNKNWDKCSSVVRKPPDNLAKQILKFSKRFWKSHKVPYVEIKSKYGPIEDNLEKRKKKNFFSTKI